MNRPAKSLALPFGIVSVALAGMLALTACSGAPQSEGEGSMANETAAANPADGYRKISATDGQALMEEGNVTVVDVRTAGEYAEKHIPGAINIPVESIGDQKPAELSDTDSELIVYCRTGVRSKQAADKLLALGYRQVNDMGGIVDWTGETTSGTEPGIM